MTLGSALAADRSCRLVPEATVRALLSRLDVFAIVRSASLSASVQHGPAASALFSGHDVGVKIGKINGSGFGIKVRAGEEGRYLSLAWDERGRMMGLVESSYLTYCRTAAALLLPATELGSTMRSVLIMGNGPLGQACALLARDLHPHSRIELWSRTSRQLSPECENAIDGWWTPGPEADARLDLIVTCTRSDVPLPLDTVDARYVSVGGAVNGRRRELPANLLRDVGAVYADDPRQVGPNCRDFDGLLPRPLIRPFSQLVFESRASVGRTLTFACAGGGYDALLAARVLSVM